MLILRELEDCVTRRLPPSRVFQSARDVPPGPSAHAAKQMCHEGVLEGGKAMRQLREITKKTTRTMTPRTLIATGLATFI